MTSAKPIAAVIDEFALQAFPGLDFELGKLGALVMRCFSGLPNPQLLCRLPEYQVVAVVGGRGAGGLRERLEAATAASGVPIVAVLPPGATAEPVARLPGVVDVLPAEVAAPAAAQRVVLMARVPVVRGGCRHDPAQGAVAPAAPRVPVWPSVAPRPVAEPQAPAASALAGPLRVLGIASSTGGVWVLAELLRALPREAPLAVVVAQHMEAEFVGFFAEWLTAASGWPTVTVRGPTQLEPGHAFVAAGHFDLCVESAGLTPAAPSSRFVPSGDRLLETLGRSHGGRAIGVVLSGMGADGARGLAELARAGGRAICQLPSTAVVASMPESALRAVPEARVVAPPELPSAVLEI